MKRDDNVLSLTFCKPSTQQRGTTTSGIANSWRWLAQPTPSCGVATQGNCFNWPWEPDTLSPSAKDKLTGAKISTYFGWLWPETTTYSRVYEQNRRLVATTGPRWWITRQWRGGGPLRLTISKSSFHREGRKANTRATTERQKPVWRVEEKPPMWRERCCPLSKGSPGCN